MAVSDLKDSTMRVLHYVPVFSQISETFIYNSILCLQENGVQNAVVTDRRLFESERPFSPVFLTNPADSPLKRLGRYLQLYQFDRAWMRAMAAAIDSFKPDLIQTHFGPNGYRLLPLARRFGIPLVTAFHGYDIFALARRPTWGFRFRRLRREGAAFTFVSNYMRQTAVRLGFPQERSTIIHVGVRETDFPFNLPSTKPVSGDVRLISIGSLFEKKGHDDLIRALAILIKQGLQVSLSIIGEGAGRPRLESLIASLGVGDRVRLLGAQHRDRVREELDRAHLFALMSKTARNGNKEGIPTVMMEAQAAGLPVCSTLHSGIPEVIPEPFQRWLAPEGDVESIARCLKDAITHRDLWDEAATQGRRHIQENFSLVTETGKLIRLYQGLLHGDKA